MALTAANIIDDFPIRQRVPAVILAALLNASPRVAEMQTLRDEIETLTGNRASEESVRSAVKRVRRAIGGRAEIETLNGIGYRIRLI